MVAPARNFDMKTQPTGIASGIGPSAIPSRETFLEPGSLDSLSCSGRRNGCT